MPIPLRLRPLTREDLPRLSRWLAEPHVAHWWRDPSDLASVRASYLPCIDGTDPAEVFIIEAAGLAAASSSVTSSPMIRTGITPSAPLVPPAGARPGSTT